MSRTLSCLKSLALYEKEPIVSQDIVPVEAASIAKVVSPGLVKARFGSTEVFGRSQLLHGYRL